MTFKSVLLVLFLYVALVWVGAAYFYSGPQLVEFGLKWTAAGLVFVLASLLLSRLWIWFVLARTRIAGRPKVVRPAAIPLTEEQAAVRKLLEEAQANYAKASAFAKAPGSGGQEPKSVFSLPLYLLMGPEGSGKSSTFVNSGLAPLLLAGEETGLAASLPTRFCNLWYARDALFLEVGGRYFSGDPNQLASLLKTLQARPALPWWRQLWEEPPPSLALQGAVAFCEFKHFMSAASPQGRDRLETLSRDWRERLGAVAQVFNVNFPVYVLVTKCDTIPHFPEFFKRVPESEAVQVFGSAVPRLQSTDEPGSSEALEVETKRLTKTFSALYHSLAERRLTHLAQEPDVTMRAGIYEFPRELKRIRPALVQFITSVFRPHPLRTNPQLRGYFLSGTGESIVPLAVADSRAQWSDEQFRSDASVLFRSDATQIFRPNEPTMATRAGAATSPARRWLFVTELFQTVIRREVPEAPVAIQRKATEVRRKGVALAVCAFCLLLCGVLLNSWIRNAGLLGAVQHEVDITRDKTDRLTVAGLRSLDGLRNTVERLTSYERGGPPWSLRWGLYAGNNVVDAAKTLYFRHFGQLLLYRINASLVGDLNDLPSSPGADEPFQPAFNQLKTHLLISSSSPCPPDPAAVSRGLKDVLGRLAPAGESGGQWTALAERQIDFYADELHFGNPCSLALNATARDHARAYLSQIQGVDRIYAGILAAAEKSVSKSQRLQDLSSSYTEVLNGPAQISSVFSREGWAFVEKASGNSVSSAPNESCVLGDTNKNAGEARQNAALSQAIQRMFIRDYIAGWRKYLSAFTVKGYGGPADAARKLDMLADHKSPLLALMAMTSNQTDFPATAAPPESFERVTPIVKKFFPSLAKGEKLASALVPSATQDSFAGSMEITRAFQPVHWVLPANSPTWVADKNSAYVDSLAQLGHAMADIARMPSTPDPAIFQAGSQSYDKAMEAARQLERGFQPMGVGGLDDKVKALLEAPIIQTRRFISNDVGDVTAAKVNAGLRGLCSQMAATLHKYPFRPSRDDTSIEEVNKFFAPGSGAIWKFQAQSLADFGKKEANHWISQDVTKKPQIAADMLTFLNRAQAITDALYPPGAAQPQFTYLLRPRADPSYKDVTIEMEVDGQSHVWTSSIQKQFTWPAAPGVKSAGAIGRIKVGNLSVPFASRGGPWGIFRLMGDAEPRAVGSKLVEWKYIRGGDGRQEEIQPAPVRLEIVEFPGGVDIFNPRFFEALQCPVKAVQ